MTGLQFLAALIRRNGPVFAIDSRTGDVSTLTVSEYLTFIGCGGRDCYVRWDANAAQTVRARILSSKAKTN
jgi:hypothetical protein